MYAPVQLELGTNFTFFFLLPAPYSWPKDHPGRAEAIAADKAKKRAAKSKVIGAGGNARSVPSEPAGPMKVESGKEVKEEAEDMVVGDQDLNVPAPTEGGAVELGDGDSFDEEVQMPGVIGDDDVGATAEVEGVKEVEKDFDEVEKDAQEKTENEKAEAAAEVAEKAERIEAAKARAAAREAANERRRAVSPTGRFDEANMAKGEFGPVSEVVRDDEGDTRELRDPVTGEMVTAVEFRKRVKARGMVRLNLEKFETMDEKAEREREVLRKENFGRSKEGRIKNASPRKVDSEGGETVEVEAEAGQTTEAGGAEAVDEEVEVESEVAALKFADEEEKAEGFVDGAGENVVENVESAAPLNVI